MSRSTARNLVLLCLLPAGCAGAAGDRQIRISRIDGAVTSAASQIRRCYQTPRVPSSGRSIVTRLRVHFGTDGALLGYPELVSQYGITAENRPYAERMAQAATAAVILCSPVRLPTALHKGGWDDFDLSFAYTMRV